MQRNLTIILFMLLSCATCFGQTTFQGITPGKSTRAQAERVFGKPLQSVSQTLIEYAPKAEADKVYMQYRDASPDAVVERIEVTCTHDGWGMNTPNSMRCSRWNASMQGDIDLSKPDAFKKSNNPLKTTNYIGSPRFVVNSTRYLSGLQQTESWGFYSRELFENAAPTRGCTGTIYGDWDTNYGRMTVIRDGDPVRNDSGNIEQRVKGSYSKNNGTFTGTKDYIGMIWGEWKDDTGTGTLILSSLVLGEDTLSGEWERETGRGPAKGKLTGRCVATN